MSFTDTPFLVLLVVVYFLWLLCRRHETARLLVLLLGSVIFYGYHQKWLLGLLLAYCLVNWLVGCCVARWRWSTPEPTPRQRRLARLVLGLGVTFNLVVLGYWKYTPPLLQTL